MQKNTERSRSSRNGIVIGFVVVLVLTAVVLVVLDRQGYLKQQTSAPVSPEQSTVPEVTSERSTSPWVIVALVLPTALYILYLLLSRFREDGGFSELRREVGRVARFEAVPGDDQLVMHGVPFVLASNAPLISDTGGSNSIKTSFKRFSWFAGATSAYEVVSGTRIEPRLSPHDVFWRNAKRIMRLVKRNGNRGLTNERVLRIAESNDTLSTEDIIGDEANRGSSAYKKLMATTLRVTDVLNMLSIATTQVDRVAGMEVLAKSFDELDVASEAYKQRFGVDEVPIFNCGRREDRVDMVRAAVDLSFINSEKVNASTDRMTTLSDTRSDRESFKEMLKSWTEGQGLAESVQGLKTGKSRNWEGQLNRSVIQTRKVLDMVKDDISKWEEILGRSEEESNGVGDVFADVQSERSSRSPALSMSDLVDDRSETGSSSDRSGRSESRDSLSLAFVQDEDLMARLANAVLPFSSEQEVNQKVAFSTELSRRLEQLKGEIFEDSSATTQLQNDFDDLKRFWEKTSALQPADLPTEVPELMKKLGEFTRSRVNRLYSEMDLFREQKTKMEAIGTLYSAAVSKKNEKLLSERIDAFVEDVNSKMEGFRRANMEQEIRESKSAVETLREVQAKVRRIPLYDTVLLRKLEFEQMIRVSKLNSSVIQSNLDQLQLSVRGDAADELRDAIETRSGLQMLVAIGRAEKRGELLEAIENENKAREKLREKLGDDSEQLVTVLMVGSLFSELEREKHRQAILRARLENLPKETNKAVLEVYDDFIQNKLDGIKNLLDSEVPELSRSTRSVSSTLSSRDRKKLNTALREYNDALRDRSPDVDLKYSKYLLAEAKYSSENNLPSFVKLLGDTIKFLEKNLELQAQILEYTKIADESASAEEKEELRTKKAELDLKFDALMSANTQTAEEEFLIASTQYNRKLAEVAGSSRALEGLIEERETAREKSIMKMDKLGIAEWDQQKTKTLQENTAYDILNGIHALRERYIRIAKEALTVRENSNQVLNSFAVMDHHAELIRGCQKLYTAFAERIGYERSDTENLLKPMDRVESSNLQQIINEYVSSPPSREGQTFDNIEQWVSGIPLNTLASFRSEMITLSQGPRDYDFRNLEVVLLATEGGGNGYRTMLEIKEERKNIDERLKEWYKERQVDIDEKATALGSFLARRRFLADLFVAKEKASNDMKWFYEDGIARMKRNIKGYIEDLGLNDVSEKDFLMKKDHTAQTAKVALENFKIHDLFPSGWKVPKRKDLAGEKLMQMLYPDEKGLTGEYAEIGANRDGVRNVVY